MQAVGVNAGPGRIGAPYFRAAIVKFTDGPLTPDRPRSVMLPEVATGGAVLPLGSGLGVTPHVYAWVMGWLLPNVKVYAKVALRVIRLGQHAERFMLAVVIPLEPEPTNRGRHGVPSAVKSC